MYKISRYLLLFTIACSSNACKKFLSVEPKVSIADDATIVDETSANTAINGVYNALGSSGYYAVSFPVIGYASGDNVEYIGTLVYNNQFTSHTVRADNQTILVVWKAAYNTINRANHVIAKVPGVSDEGFTQEERDKLLGEAHFIRSLAYFDIVRIWGGAPIVLTPTLAVVNKVGVARSTADEVYAQVFSDLTKAETLLPNTLNRFRATKKTAWALLSRYYLYRKDWAQAESFATRLIGDAGYRLSKPYNSFFASNVTGSVESIFEIQYSPKFLNDNRNDWQPASNGGGRRIVPTNAFIELVNNPLVGGNRNTILGRTSTGLWYGNLYYRSPATDPSYIIRIAELFLIRAEARAQQNKLGLAAEDLNAVRDRAGLSVTTAATQEQLLLAIENENRLEFGLEPHRWFDLVRTGRAQQVLGITDPNKLLLPIPSDEIIIDDALKQNPGY